jgi:acetylornithine/succinyldiaminopimelate/putrescine aminotransferase
VAAPERAAAAAASAAAGAALTAEVVADEGRYVLQTYVRPELVFVRGEGTLLFDAEGKEYLDFAAGIAVNALGAHAARAPRPPAPPRCSAL